MSSMKDVTRPEETDPALPIRQLLAASKDSELEVVIDEQIIRLTHLEKPLWQMVAGQEAKLITKRQLIEYYLAISTKLLPHLLDRPLTLKRYPNGIQEASIMQRHIDETPDFVQTVEICSDAAGNNQPFLLCNNLATLVWLANLDSIELHPWNSRINPGNTKLPTIFINSVGTLEMSVLNYPDWLVFDIDATETGDRDGAFKKSLQAAELVHNQLEGLSLRSLPKLSGQTGIHIYVPLVRDYPFDQVRQAAKTLSQRLAEQYPETFTTEWHVDKRQGRVFLDWQQNARAKSMVAPYSVRGNELATISQPLSWDTLNSTNPSDHTLLSTLANSEAQAIDPWGDLTKLAQRLPDDLLS